MKRKGQRNKGKIILSKRNDNSKLEDFFKSPSNNSFNSSSIKNNNSSSTNTNKKLCIIRNPSKTRLIEETQQELKKFHNLAKKTILCDTSILSALYTKLLPSFDKIDRFLSKNKKCEVKNINKRHIIVKFMSQLKYTDIVYIPPSLLSEEFNEEKIAQNIRNFVGFNNKGVTMNFSPNRTIECEIFWPNITENISNYLNNFHEGKGLYIYVEHDYLSYLDKIKLLCSLKNYETVVIDESNQTKCMILDKLSEAMQTKRLPSISEQLGKQMLMLEEMVNSFSYKWKVFTKITDNNTNIINLNNNDSTNNNNNYSNNISSSSNKYSSESKNSPIILSNKDIDNVFDEIDIKNNNNTIQCKNKENKNCFKLDEFDENISKNNDQLSTSETSFINYQKKRKNKNKSKDRNLCNSREKSKDKSKDKSKNNSRNKSSELKKRRNKKENGINNTNIKGYFNENTKEHKTFTQLQNNIFLYCTKAKTAIIIADSFSDDEKDKKYFNNILLKISQTKCPIIILTNNLNNIYNNTQKKIKNLNIKCILPPKNKRDMTLIYLYNFILYLNIKLCTLKFTKDINTYEKLYEYINNIQTDLNKFELCVANLKIIFTISEYLCYYGKFQIDIIDLRLSEIFLKVENDINTNKIDSNDFDNILNYIYNCIFEKNDDNNLLELDEKSIDEIYEECEMRSFLDFSDGIQEHLINKNYENKLKLNDSFDNYCKSKDSMVNLEGLILGKYFIDKDLFINKSKNNNNNINNCDLDRKKSFSIYDSFNNKIINKLNKEDQLFLSNNNKIFIPISSLNNYIFPIKRKIIINKNLNKYKITSYFESYRKSDDKYEDFIDIHNSKKLFQKVEDKYFLNKNNINYATNLILKKTINQKKIITKFYEQ